MPLTYPPEPGGSGGAWSKSAVIRCLPRADCGVPEPRGVPQILVLGPVRRRDVILVRTLVPDALTWLRRKDSRAVFGAPDMLSLGRLDRSSRVTPAKLPRRRVSGLMDVCDWWGLSTAVVTLQKDY